MLRAAMALCLIGIQCFLLFGQEHNNSKILLKDAFALVESNYNAHCVYEQSELMNKWVESPDLQVSFHQAIVSLSNQAEFQYEFVRPKVVMLKPLKEFKEPTLIKEIKELYVVDGENGEPLSFAFLINKTDQMVEVTDEAGYVQIEYAKNDCYRVQYLGYEDYLYCPKLEDGVKRLELEKEIYEIPEIQLGADRSLKAGSTEIWNGEIYNIKRLSRSGGQVGFSDPLRGLQFLPGVANFDDYSANVQIRGGDYDENQILLDDLPLYNVEHYFGFCSNIPSYLAQELTLYKEAIPPEFGGRASSVIDIQSGQMPKQFEGAINISNLIGSAQMDIPLADNLAARISARSSIVNLARSDYFTADREAGPGQIFIGETNGKTTDLETESEPESDFQDYYASILWEPGRNSKLRLNGFYSNDDYANQVSHERFFERVNRNITLIGLDDEEQRENIAFGFRWDQQWGKGLKQQSLINYSSYNYDFRKAFAVRNPDNGRFLLGDYYENYCEITGIKIQHQWIKTFSAGSKLQFGMESLSEESQFIVTDRDKQIAIESGNTLSQAFFASFTAQIKNQWQYSFGVRSTYYDNTSDWYLSPRVLLRRKISDDIYIQGAWSLQPQFLREVYFETPTGRSFNYYAMADGQRIPVLEANQFSLSSGMSMGQIGISISAYIKHYDGVVEQLASIIGIDEGQGSFFRRGEFLFIQGEGRNQGIEFNANWYGDPLEFIVNYTLSKNSVFFDPILNGAEIAAPNDRRHQLNALLAFKPSERTRLSLEYSYASGRPFTDVTKTSDRLLDRRSQDLELRESRLESYQRLDLSISYMIPMSTGSLEITGQVFNILDRKNQFYEEYFYSFRNQGERGLPQNFVLGYEQELLGITPSIGLNYTW